MLRQLPQQIQARLAAGFQLEATKPTVRGSRRTAQDRRDPVTDDPLKIASWP
jgi:hypothetical protein